MQNLNEFTQSNQFKNMPDLKSQYTKVLET